MADSFPPPPSLAAPDKLFFNGHSVTLVAGSSVCGSHHLGPALGVLGRRTSDSGPPYPRAARSELAHLVLTSFRHETRPTNRHLILIDRDISSASMFLSLSTLLIYFTTRVTHKTIRLPYL